jgi:ankyrin repeat protein
VRLIDEDKVSFATRNAVGQTALHIAAHHNRTDVIERLISTDHLDPNVVDS